MRKAIQQYKGAQFQKNRKKLVACRLEITLFMVVFHSHASGITLLRLLRFFKYIHVKISASIHYENMPMQCTEIFKDVKNENFQKKIFDIFLIFAQSIDCGYKLEPLRRGGSNEYPQSMFWGKNKKKYVYPCIPQFYYIKVGFKGVFIARTCFPDVNMFGSTPEGHSSYFCSNCWKHVVKVYFFGTYWDELLEGEVLCRKYISVT